ncbi:MAG: HAMP domain-containing histidine kinase [Planctomycetes bacterium]|nr:HAMP domain-containing histidine kinase [Planctomycetota bacterium]
MKLFDFDAELELSVDTLRDVLEAVPSGILVLDLIGQPKFANYLGMLLLREGVDLPGEGSIESLCRPDLLEVVKGVFEDVRRVGFCSPRALELHAGGGPGRAGLLGSLLRTADGLPRGVVLVVEDQTARHALRELEAHQDRTSSKLQVAAHEIRGPLTGVLGHADLLLMTQGPPVTDRVEKLRREGERISDLVKSMLDTQQVTSGLTELKLERVDLSCLLRDLHERFEISAHEHELVLDLDPEIPLMVSDPLALERVFNNLLSNATKYSPPGTRVELRAVLLEAVVEVRVIDSGPGIAPEDAPFVFDAFYRPRSSKQAVPGSGIGLALVKALVEAHGGAVKLITELGAGSTFRVRLPVSATPTRRFSQGKTKWIS